MESPANVVTDVSFLDRLAAEIADFSVVPFIGSGCSLGLTAGADWHAVTALLSEELGIAAEADGPSVAQRYVDRFGRAALERRLAERLTIPAFLDDRGGAHLALMCLRFPAIYTTNVENAVELAHAKYGRPLSVVARLEDLKSIVPGRTVLYKYHGDLAVPETIVWTTDDYARRAAERDVFLNVRLRSDLLVKRLLFVGYSLRDPHVVDLLARAQALYGPGMRGGTVIAAHDVLAFAEALSKEGLPYDVIDPRGMFPDEASVGAAIQRVLGEILNRVVAVRRNRGLEAFLAPSTPEPVPVLSLNEILALETATPSLSPADAVKTFRSLCDMRMIPKDFQPRVVDLICVLMRRARREGLVSFRGLLANLRLDPTHAVHLAMHAYTLYAAGCTESLHVNGIDERRPWKMVYFAGAYQVLQEAGETVSPAFANYIAREAFGSEDLQPLPQHLQQPIRATFAEIFKGLILTDPLTRPYPGVRLPEMTHDDFTSLLVGSLPALFRIPFEG